MMGDSMTEARRKSLPWSAGVLGCGCATVVGFGPRVGRWEGGLLGCWWGVESCFGGCGCKSWPGTGPRLAGLHRNLEIVAGFPQGSA
jgi:hypothetical protein